MLDTIDDTGKVTHNGMLMGTPAYMSPEQIQEKKLDERSDLYSLGCVMFETLTGQPVFDAETVMDLLNRQAHDHPPALSDASDTEFAPELEQIIKQLLAKNPDHRFQTMQELKDSIEDLLVDAEDLEQQPISTEAQSTESDGDRLLFESDFMGYQDPAASPDDSTKVQKTKVNRLTAILVACAIIALSYVAVSSIISDGSKDIKIGISSLSFADDTWTIVEGNAHGKNASRLKQCKNDKNMKIIDPEFDDQDLQQLNTLPLKMLDLTGTNISDRGLKSISEIKTIQCLLIGDNERITDAGMNTLRFLPNLRVLSVKGTRITDTGVGALINIPKLASLDLSNLNKVTAVSLQSLQNMPNMLFLRIGRTGIKPADLKILKNFRVLRGVSVRDLDLGDAEMAMLGELQGLVLLDVSNNSKVTSAGIEKFTPPKFWRLTFDGCGITPEEKEAIDTKIVENIGSPVPVAVDFTLLPGESAPADMERDVYLFWYNPKYAEPKFFAENRAWSRSSEFRKTRIIDLRRDAVVY